MLKAYKSNDGFIALLLIQNYESLAICVIIHFETFPVSWSLQLKLIYVMPSLRFMVRFSL